MDPIIKVMSMVANETPTARLRFLVVAWILDARPLFFIGRAIIISALFGVWKMQVPMPMTAKAISTVGMLASMNP